MPGDWPQNCASAMMYCDCSFLLGSSSEPTLKICESGSAVAAVCDPLRLYCGRIIEWPKRNAAIENSNGMKGAIGVGRVIAIAVGEDVVDHHRIADRAKIVVR